MIVHPTCRWQLFRSGYARVCSPTALLAALSILLPGLAFAAADGVPCKSRWAKPLLTFETAVGDVKVRLEPAAAPHTVARLVRLARGPIFDADLVTSNLEVGFYDGLGFDFTKPNIEVRTATRNPVAAFSFPMEVDANSLGLDKRQLESAGTAMDVWQMELYPHFTRHEHRGGVTTRLADWVQRWRESHQADFLVGVSRKTINEALGYEYTEGLESIPARRGAVLAHPATPTRSTARLRFLLTDMPSVDGRATVVGRVAEGLDVLGRIAASPLLPPPYVDKNAYRPVDPVVIEHVRVSCKARAAR